ncbi:hypothetical protein HJC23_000374 [Cyclotella cryptica]|uniref:N-acetyltransferase domain-containing protein n=1 Tax=Cyclotella cryptica TaxID=29204 RepID=A0ABD3P6C5_9STRA|eukprot:CCRYP_017029-RA/>CCRYP_017029-RA protein AED:0.47 eAED:0.47 QI:0/-1/0/1/-1/1/1/0/328
MRAALLFNCIKDMADSYAPKVSGGNHEIYRALPPSLCRFRPHNSRSLNRHLNIMHSQGSSSLFLGGEENLESTVSWSCHSPASESIASGDNGAEPYRIEMVNTKRRLLDVKVFRGFSMTPEEFIWKRNHPIGNESTHNRRSCEIREAISEDDAINLLMPDYDELGRYMKFRSDQTNYEQEVYFVAVYCSCNGAEANAKIDLKSFERTNGVVGVVSAQQRNCLSVTEDSSIYDTDQQASNLEVPFPHIYLANMNVHQSFRRMGIGRALLSSVTDYAKTFSHDKHIQMRTALPIVLSVDNDNNGAVTTYEKFGFEYIGKNNIFGTMVFWT